MNELLLRILEYFGIDPNHPVGAQLAIQVLEGYVMEAIEAIEDGEEPDDDDVEEA